MPLCIRRIAAVFAGGVALFAFESGRANAAEHRWLEAAQVNSFDYRADFHLDERDRLLAELEQLRTELFKTLAVPPPTETIELYLFGDEASYRRYLEQRFGNLPKRRALYIKAGGPGMVYAYRGDQFVVDLRHETTHAFLHAALDSVPLWLDEGLAEYFEVPPVDRTADPHLRDLRQHLSAGQLPRLESLERLDDSSGMRRDDYIAAWGWTHFLLNGSTAGRDELVSYLAEANKGIVATPISVRLRVQMPDLERRFESYYLCPPTRTTQR